MAGVRIDTGDFPLMRNVDRSYQPNRANVYALWSKAFHQSVPEAIEHLADVIEDVYAFELWKDRYLDTPEEFFERLGLFSLDLENPAKLIKELRKKRSSKKAQIIARAKEANRLRSQGLTQQQVAEKLGVSQQTVSDDLLPGNRVMTPKPGKPPRRVYQISQYTKPDVAAGKLRETFGEEWCCSLCRALEENINGALPK